jgi:hypothetical protein
MELNPSPGDPSPWRRIPEPRKVLEHFGEAVGMLVNPPAGSVRSVGYEDINDYPWRSSSATDWMATCRHLSIPFGDRPRTRPALSQFESLRAI